MLQEKVLNPPPVQVSPWISEAPLRWVGVLPSHIGSDRCSLSGMNICYASCGPGENGQDESHSEESSSSVGSSSDKDDLPHQSSVMAIVRERLRTAHGVERNDSDKYLWPTDPYGEEPRSAKCKLPLRYAVSSLIVIAILASSCSMYSYLMLEWSRAHAETLNLFKESGCSSVLC